MLKFKLPTTQNNSFLSFFLWFVICIILNTFVYSCLLSVLENFLSLNTILVKKKFYSYSIIFFFSLITASFIYKIIEIKFVIIFTLLATIFSIYFYFYTHEWYISLQDPGVMLSKSMNYFHYGSNYKIIINEALNFNYKAPSQIVRDGKLLLDFKNSFPIFISIFSLYNPSISIYVNISVLFVVIFFTLLFLQNYKELNLKSIIIISILFTSPSFFYFFRGPFTEPWYLVGLLLMILSFNVKNIILNVYLSIVSLAIFYFLREESIIFVYIFYFIISLHSDDKKFKILFYFLSILFFTSFLIDDHGIYENRLANIKSENFSLDLKYVVSYLIKYKKIFNLVILLIGLILRYFKKKIKIVLEKYIFSFFYSKKVLYLFLIILFVLFFMEEIKYFFNLEFQLRQNKNVRSFNEINLKKLLLVFPIWLILFTFPNILKNINFKKKILSEQKIILLLCFFVFCYLSYNVHNSPQIYWFSRRYLPFVFIIMLFSICFGYFRGNKYGNLILLVVLIVQISYYKPLVNFSGLKETLKINEQKLSANNLYVYENSVKYRRALSFFQNVYNLKMIPHNQINNLKDRSNHYYFLTSNKCPINSRQTDILKLNYKEIIHVLPKFNIFKDKIPHLPKKYYNRAYLIKICKVN